MKFLMVILFTILFSITGYNQNVYYDAIKLKKYALNDTLTSITLEIKQLIAQESFLRTAINNSETARNRLPYLKELRDSIIRVDSTLQNNSLDTIYSILKIYFPNISSSTALSNIADSFQSNPFLKTIPVSGRTQGESNISTNSTAHRIFPSIGGLDVTNLADALAKFLVKRAKQELTIAFFDKFNEHLKKYPDLQTVFPNTYLAITVAGEEIYNYQGYIQTLRESYQKDLDAIDKNLRTIIDNHPTFFKLHPELAATLNSSWYIVGGLKDKVHPGEILDKYSVAYLDSLKNANWKGAIQTLQLFSASLRDTAFHDTTGNYWVSAKQIKELVKDKVTFQIYLGLLYQQAKTFNTDSTPVMFQNNTSLNTILDSVAKNLNPVRDFVTAISQRTEKLNNLIKNKAKPATDSLAIEQYYTYFNASIDLLKQCTKITDIPVFGYFIKDTLSKSMSDYFGVVQSTADIVVDIARRNYSSAIVNTVHVYDLVVMKKDKTKDTIQNKKIMGSIFKYGSFMAAAVQAKNSDEIENTIEAFALPQGSSRVKRESPFNVSLNGYAGLFYGHEYIKGINDKLAFNSFGVTAPIGIATSFGHSLFFFRTGKDNWTKGKRGWSSSIFVSLIDLGAVAAYRVNNDSVAQVPTIQLKDIFSPGVFLSIGIPKSPLSFNMGAQVGPNLRKVDDAKNDYSNKTYVRLSASLCVDIPVLNFYTKSR